jgi:hypothetical protein
MKKLVILFVLVAFGVSFTYSQVKNNMTLRAKLLKTYTNPANASDDTTGFITVSNVKVLDGSYVGIFCVATDSVQAAVYVIGSNSAIPGSKLVYADSISTILFGVNGKAAFATTPYFKGITLRGGGVDRLSGCDQFKIGTVFPAGADSNPYDATKTVKWYLYWVN